MRRVLLLLVSLFFSVACLAKPINWLTDDQDELPYMLSGEPHSIGTDTLKLVLDAIEYDYELRLASIERINMSLKSTPNTCVASRIKTPERAKDNLFSLPVNLHPMARIYFVDPNISVAKHLLNERGELVSIAALLKANPERKIALSKSVSYGPELDRKVSQIPRQSINYYDADNRYFMGVKLLVDGLTDLSLLYPTEFSKHMGVLGKDKTPTSLLIEQDSQFVVSHIACSKSSFGEQVIAQVNTVLAKMYLTDLHINAHLRHIPDSDKARFIEDYRRYFSTYKEL